MLIIKAGIEKCLGKIVEKKTNHRRESSSSQSGDPALKTQKYWNFTNRDTAIEIKRALSGRGRQLPF